MRRNLCLIACSLLALLVVAPATWAEEPEGEQEIEGTVELLYRNVSQDGSAQKYDEDFDGLATGARLSNLELELNNIDRKGIDFFSLDASGLGGDPYQRSSLRLGQRELYELEISHTKQSYRYNLFAVEFDQDASSWNTDRSITDLDLTIHASDRVDVFFEVQEVRRDGTSFFLKDINTDLFQLETPLDQNVRRYSVGARFAIGKADVLFRQTLMRRDTSLHNSTTGNAGLDMSDLATLDRYDWVQQDRSEADLTTVTLSVPLGRRVNLKATAYGTLLGKEDLDSQVALDASGTSFQGICSVSLAICNAGNPCDSGIPGNFCAPNAYNVAGGSSSAEIEADYLAIGGDLSVKIVEPLDFHLQVHRLDREINGIHDRDLDGNGVPDDTEGTVNDPTPGSTTRVEYSLTTLTGLLDYEPCSKVRIRAGYRTIDRDLKRSGFEYGTNDYRNTDHESGTDDTLILGLKLKPVSWFHLDADYEQGDVAQAFTAASPAETDRLRLRARFRPGGGTQLDVGYLAYENSHIGVDFRRPGDCGPGDDVDNGCWRSLMEGTTYSASFWHKATKHFDYWLRWAENEIDRVTRIHFDTDVLFGSTEVGDSIYGNSNTELAAQANFNWASHWRAFVRAHFNESDGQSSIAGSTFLSTLPVAQDFSDLEGGLTYSFTNGLYVGARFRSFDYDDRNDALDYDGDISSILVGFHF